MSVYVDPQKMAYGVLPNTGNKPVAAYETINEAHEDCLQRSKISKKMGLKTRYQIGVSEPLDGDAYRRKNWQIIEYSDSKFEQLLIASSIKLGTRLGK